MKPLSPLLIFSMYLSITCWAGRKTPLPTDKQKGRELRPFLYAASCFCFTSHNRGGQGVNNGLQRQTGASLLWDVGHMDEAYLHGCVGIAVKQSIHHIVAHECPCRIGHRCGDTGLADPLSHFFHRNCGKIGRRSLRVYHFSPGLLAGVIGDPGIPDVDGDPLRCHRLPATGLAHTQYHIRLHLFRLFQYCFGGCAEYCGDHFFVNLKVPCLIRQPFHRQPGGIDGRPTKGIKAGDQQFLQNRSLPFQISVYCTVLS